MLKKDIDRYNELLKKFLGDSDFNELLALANNYWITSKIDEERAGIPSLKNPYERLIKDLENREKNL